MRLMYLRYNADEPFRNVDHITAYATNFEHGVMDILCRVHVMFNLGDSPEKELIIKLKIDGRWYSDPLRLRALDYMEHSMTLPFAAKIIWDIDMSTLRDPWKLIGVFASMRDLYRHSASKMVSVNLHESMRAAALGAKMTGGTSKSRMSSSIYWTRPFWLAYIERMIRNERD